MSHSKHKYRSYLLSAFFLLLGSNGIASEPKKFGNESDFSGNNITQVIEDKVSDQQSQKKAVFPLYLMRKSHQPKSWKKEKKKQNHQSIARIYLLKNAQTILQISCLQR